MGLFHSIGHFFSKIGHGISHGWHEITHHPTYLLGGLSLIPGLGTALGLGSSTILGGALSAGEGALGSIGSSLGLGSLGNLGSIGSLLGLGGSATSLLGGGGLGTLGQLGNIGYDIYSLSHRNSIPNMPTYDYSSMPKLSVDVKKPVTTSAPNISGISQGMNYGFRRSENFATPQVNLNYSIGNIANKYSGSLPQPYVNRIKRESYNKLTNTNFDFGNGYGFNMRYDGGVQDVTHPTNTGQGMLYAPPGMEAVVTTHYQPNAKDKRITILSGFKDRRGNVYKIPRSIQPIIGTNGKSFGGVTTDWLRQLWAKAGIRAANNPNAIANSGLVRGSGYSDAVMSGIMPTQELTAKASTVGSPDTYNFSLANSMLSAVTPNVVNSVASSITPPTQQNTSTLASNPAFNTVYSTQEEAQAAAQQAIGNYEKESTVNSSLTHVTNNTTNHSRLWYLLNANKKKNNDNWLGNTLNIASLAIKKAML